MKTIKFLLAILFSIAVVACGGGGSSGGSTATFISATADTTPQNLTVGTAMVSFTPLTARDGAPPYTYFISTGTLPAGLTLNPGTGAVTGTPTVVQNAFSDMVDVEFSVRDASLDKAVTTSTVSFTVGIGATANIIPEQNLAVGMVIVPFTPLTAIGDSTKYIYFISSANTLPAGLSLNPSTGLVTGTPTAAYGPADVEFLVRDFYNESDVAMTTSTVSFTVGIGATANTTPQNLTVGTAMVSFTPLQASGGATPYTYSYTPTGTLPAGLNFDDKTGAVTGTPTAAYATANLVFSVKDANSVGAATTSTVSFFVTGLNDTGITASQCYRANDNVLVACNITEATTLNNAQDGMVGRDVTTNNSTDGNLGFSFTVVTSGCVLDNVTGLMWEVKTNDTVPGLRDWNNIYTNQSGGQATDTSGFVTAVNTAALCGYSDWRLPTADELQSIVDYGVAYPSIDATRFPNTQGGAFWSASPLINDTSSAWLVDFGAGSDNSVLRSNTGYVRLVRAGR